MKGTLTFLYRIYKSHKTGSPYKINFAITSSCNSRCKHCNVWKKQTREKELSFIEIDELFKKLPSTIQWLSISGGEPFMRSDLDKIIISAEKNIKSLKLISIITNGLDKEKILSVLKNIKKVKIDVFMMFSLDGPEKVHDKIRGINGAFKKTWSNYILSKKILKKNKNFNVGLETTISDLNILSVKSFITRLSKNGHKLTLTIAHNASLYKNENDNILLDDNAAHFLPSIISEKVKHINLLKPNEIIEYFYLEKTPSYLKNRQNMVLPCVALKVSLAINPYGDVIPCFMWDEPLGNLRDFDYNLSEVWNNNKRRDARKIIVNENCPNCWTPCEAYQTLIARLFLFK